MCFLTGSIALIHVRKQKVQSASLFEQRKHGAAQKPISRYTDFVNGSGSNGNNNDHDNDIELSRMDDIESIPLIGDTSNNSNHHSLLEVV